MSSDCFTPRLALPDESAPCICSSREQYIRAVANFTDSFSISQGFHSETRRVGSIWRLPACSLPLPAERPDGFRRVTLADTWAIVFYRISLLEGYFSACLPRCSPGAARGGGGSWLPWSFGTSLNRYGADGWLDGLWGLHALVLDVDSSAAEGPSPLQDSASLLFSPRLARECAAD